MNPLPVRVLVVQPMASDGPSFLATFLREAGVTFTLVSVERGDPVPVSASEFDAIAMLGGAMSVNDDLPFLHSARQLMGDAVARGVPVLGHCLGGQMLAQALGGSVADNSVTEIGWARITLHHQALARAWLGKDAALTVFQWHSQTFTIPEGATLLAGNDACAHQAFAVGPHLGMQFHIEVDAEKLERWADDVPAAASATMRAATTRHLAASQRVATRIYRRWLALALNRRERVYGQDKD